MRTCMCTVFVHAYVCVCACESSYLLQIAALTLRLKLAYVIMSSHLHFTRPRTTSPSVFLPPFPLITLTLRLTWFRLLWPRWMRRQVRPSVSSIGRACATQKMARECPKSFAPASSTAMASSRAQKDRWVPQLLYPHCWLSRIWLTGISSIMLPYLYAIAISGL